MQAEVHDHWDQAVVAGDDGGLAAAVTGETERQTPDYPVGDRWWWASAGLSVSDARAITAGVLVVHELELKLPESR